MQKAWPLAAFLAVAAHIGYAAAGDPAKIAFIAGPPSHGPGEHEYRAGSILLAKCLDESVPDADTVVVSNGWPQDPSVLDDAAAIVVYTSGGGGHFLNTHAAEFQSLVDKGVGLVCLHYAVETSKGEYGENFLQWLGGYFEPHWSVNPHWTASFDRLPDHPITKGVAPFELNDEWYYHMRFVPEMKGVTPILSALPPPSTLERGDGPHSGNPYVRRAVANGELQHTAWAYERPDGGRAFGFTGGHFHRAWQNDNVRKLVLNAILWTARIEVPPQGVPSPTPTDEQMKQNLDPKR